MGVLSRCIWSAGYAGVRRLEAVHFLRHGLSSYYVIFMFNQILSCQVFPMWMEEAVTSLRLKQIKFSDHLMKSRTNGQPPRGRAPFSDAKPRHSVATRFSLKFMPTLMYIVHKEQNASAELQWLGSMYVFCTT